MTDIEIMRDYIDARIMLLEKSIAFYLEIGDDSKCLEKMAMVTELKMMLEVLADMEEEL